MNIVLGISGGALYALWKLLKSLFDNGHWVWALIIIVVVAVVYWLNLKDEKSSEMDGGEKQNQSENPPGKETTVLEVQKPQYPPTPAGCLPCGSTLWKGRFRITSYIAHGGFGNTYLAEDLLLHRPVAIKELFVRDICNRQSQTNDVQVSIETNRSTFDSLKRKFQKEAKRLQSFNDPHIIKVYHCFEENGTAYYVMDYIAGESLASLVREKGRLEESVLRKLLSGLLSALALVHKESIWHLDIKPANLMLKNNSSLVLIDFGASKQLTGRNGEALTSTSTICYTPGYAPPEQICMNTKNIGAWTDIYALGATMFNVLTGKRPPHTDEILSEGFPPFPATVSRQMADAIVRMMQPNRNARPQSIEEVALLLQ